MRNVINTNNPVDVTDEYAEKVDAILNDPFRATEHVTRHREGSQISFRVQVVGYDAPDGSGKRYAVDYFDSASREVEEFGDKAKAMMRYEELVRAAANDLSLDEDGAPIPFTATDVPGTPGYEG